MFSLKHRIVKHNSISKENTRMIIVISSTLEPFDLLCVLLVIRIQCDVHELKKSSDASAA